MSWSCGKFRSTEVGHYTIFTEEHCEEYTDTSYTVSVEDWDSDAEDFLVEEVECESEMEMMDVYHDMVNKYEDIYREELES